MTPPAATPLLPVGDLVRRTYRQVRGSLDGLIRIGLGWLLLPLAVQVVATTLGDGGFTLAIIGDVASIVGLTAIAVTWHRHVLLEEPLAGFLAPVSVKTIKYLFLAIVVAVLAALPGIVLMTVLALVGVVTADGILATLAVAVAMVVGCWVFGRLQLVFPGIAVGDPATGLAGSWALTRGNGFRLLAGVLLTILPVLSAVLIGQLLAGMFAAAGAEKLGAFLALVVASIGGWLQAPLVAAFLSYAYLFFRETAAVAAPAS